VKNNYYQLFINQVLQLAQTIVIKSTESAEALNTYVDEQAAITGSASTDSLDPTTWKYYLNLAGEYHHLDEIMYVVSRDTLEKITFTKENLAIHRATARDYQFGTRQYQELLTEYPKQDMLILGILYPVDLHEAIAAPDGKILGYPENLIESNEYSLINKLQAWINGFKLRWVIQQFGISDGLYAATALATMYVNLVPAILSFRLEACKTNEAHSYHVRQYLASHGLLDAYVDQLTIKQALFFYRNITYIERHAGKRDIFEWLVEHIMTERGLPIAEYTMRHDLVKQPDEVYPQLTFRKKSINSGYSADLVDNLTLSEILTKQDYLARDNFLIKNEVLPVIQEQMENSLSNVIMTKVLESSVIDHSNSSPYGLDEILLNHWLFLASEGLYTAFISATNPKSGERTPLNAKDAYILLWYAFCKSVGITLNVIPKMYAKRVQRLPTSNIENDPNPLPGTVDDLMLVVDDTLIDRSIAEQAISIQPEITTTISTEAFYGLCKRIYDAAQMQRNLMASQEHMVRRGMVHCMVSRIYSDNICSLAPEGETYGVWFAERNINFDDLTSSDMGLLYVDLVRQATGQALIAENSIKDLQTSMVKMLTQLSSYSVQVIAQINQSDIKQTDWTATRVGNIDQSSSQLIRYPDATVQPLTLIQSDSEHLAFALLDGSFNGRFSSKDKTTLSVPITVKPKATMLPEIECIRAPIARINARSQIPLVTNSQGIIPVIGIDLYFELTDEQQQSLKDVYNGGYTSIVYHDDGTVEQAENEATLYMKPRYVAPTFSF
jgi:hypothetical protein